MSYSFIEPDWPAYCECRYDEARDEMDREDCPFHCDMESKLTKPELAAIRRKRPMRTDDAKESAA